MEHGEHRRCRRRRRGRQRRLLVGGEGVASDRGVEGLWLM